MPVTTHLILGENLTVLFFRSEHCINTIHDHSFKFKNLGIIPITQYVYYKAQLVYNVDFGVFPTKKCKCESQSQFLSIFHSKQK